jgi:hypothetical protein
MLERKEVVFPECRSIPVRQSMNTEYRCDLYPTPQEETCHEHEEVAGG